MLSGCPMRPSGVLSERGVAVHPTHASLTGWMLNFTKPFLAFRPAAQSVIKRAPNEQHDHSAPLLDLDKGGAGDMAGRAVMALAPLAGH
jgi:hypothetical protein